MINLQFLVGKLNPVSQAATEAAAALCAARRNEQVEIAHLLLALLDSPHSDALAIFRRYGIDTARLALDLNHFLDRVPVGATATASLSPALIRLLTSAWTLASLEFGYSAIRSAALILALLEAADLREEVASASAEFQKLDAAILRQDWPLSLSPKEELQTHSALEQFTVDLTLSAKEGRIDPVIGREKEIRQIMDILTRRRQNNPILTGEAGVGKTAVVEGFALRVVADDVPPALRGVSIRSLDLGLLQAGAGIRGQFEERLKAVIAQVT
ncbi:MAG: type VI secretion system ATPase TssH, partial [Acidobacteriota bacterium]|nr:type VI secretion system ATPase TssH [Acidobacteriota bacterium]